MNGKEIGKIIGLIVAIPLLIAFIIFVIKISINPNNPEIIEEGAEIIVDSAIPWWLGLFEWLAGLPGIIGAVLIIGLVFFLKWIGEIR
jgi:hypothetical protein